MAESGEEILVEESSGNVFEDLGFKDPDEVLAKAKLAIAIKNTIKARKLSQIQAARLMGVDQPKVSKIVCGNLTEFSTDRLMSYLLHLGHDVDIVIHPRLVNVVREGSINVLYGP